MSRALTAAGHRCRWFTGNGHSIAVCVSHTVALLPGKTLWRQRASHLQREGVRRLINRRRQRYNYLPTGGAVHPRLTNGFDDNTISISQPLKTGPWIEFWSFTPFTGRRRVAHGQLLVYYRRVGSARFETILLLYYIRYTEMYTAHDYYYYYYYVMTYILQVTLHHIIITHSR